MAIVLAALAGGLTVALGPTVRRARRANAEAAARRQQLTIVRIVATERRDQVLHVAELRGRDRGAAVTSPAAVLSALRADILADARARVRAHTMDGPVRVVTCSEFQGRRDAFACLAVIGFARQRVGGPVVARVGDPFWARVDYRGRRLAWCRITPRPGEMAIASAPPAVALSPVCDLSRAAPAGW